MGARQTASQIFRGMLRAPLTTKITSSANQWAGMSTINSGSATLVVSTTIVDSDSLIFLGRIGNANVGSGINKTIEVKTISPGNYFTLGADDGQAIQRDTLIHWMIVRTQ
jgi:hypothetical protein